MTFDLEDLKRILRAGAGVDPAAGLDGEIAGVDFEELGCDSLAMLETCTRIEREYGISLGDDAVAGARTPAALVDLVRSHLSVTA
jgi:act minimal PKS acyl carrier protein